MNKIDTRTIDEVIHYLVQSKKEMQAQIKKDFHKPEFQRAIAELRALKSIQSQKKN